MRISKKIKDPTKKYFFDLLIPASELIKLKNSLNNYDSRGKDH